MKTKSRRAIGGLTVTLLLLAGTVLVRAQDPCTGTWEGMFMIEFRTVIELTSDGENAYTGRIKMYDGSQQIQDDVISEISIEDKVLHFHIKAKETDFKGRFNADFTEFDGRFIFPDKSEHPLSATKKRD